MALLVSAQNVMTNFFSKGSVITAADVFGEIGDAEYGG
jgi:hypothetical protein